jgi:hypothetical protein
LSFEIEFGTGSATILAHGIPEIDSRFAKRIFAVATATNPRTMVEYEFLPAIAMAKLRSIAWIVPVPAAGSHKPSGSDGVYAIAGLR